MQAEKDMNSNKLFKTKDFYTAAILKTVGFNLVSLERNKGKFATFVFEDFKDTASKTVKHYWDRKLDCNARILVETINELKTRIHERSS